MNLQIDHGPWLTHPDVGKMTVGFVTNLPCAARIEYHASGEPGKTLFQCSGGQIITGETLHLFHLNDLVPGETYEYRVTAFLPDTEESCEKNDSFTAFSRKKKDFSFLVLADFQFPQEKRDALLRRYYQLCQAEKCDFIVSLGDMIWEIADMEKDGLSGMADIFCELGAGSIPVLFVRGNHEMRGKENWKWNRYFGSPEGNSYSLFRQGNCAFLALDTWADQPGGPESAVHFRRNLDTEFLSAEAEFLRKAVKTEPFQSAEFRIVLAHGASHSHIDQFHFLSRNMQAMTDALFKGSKPEIPLHAWICGHIHHYLRTVPLSAGYASIHSFPQPVMTPEEYTFPVLTTDGPDVAPNLIFPSGIQSSAFLVHVGPEIMEVRAFSEEKGLIDHFRIGKDHTITEQIPINHYHWEKMRQ